MDLYPSEIEESVRAASEAYLRDNLALADARRRPAGVWRAMAEMGWFGIAVPEAAGGIGLGFAAEALVLAEMGRHLAPLGAVAAAVAAGVAHRAGDAALLEAVLAGDRRVALGLPQPDGRLRVLDAADAGLIVVATPAAGTIHATPAGWAAAPCLDPTSTQVVIDAAAAGEAVARSEGPATIAHLQLAAAGYAHGAAEAARDMAADYARTREQFGQPIGAFQGIKHPCADTAVRCSAARAQLLYAALALAGDDADAAFQVAVAKKMADAAAIQNGRTNIQVHGGIGMTDDYDAHLLLKRAHTLAFVAPVTTAMLLAA